MKQVYQSRSYAPELVTGRYVRRVKRGVYRVYETATCFDKGQFYNRPGFGPTLREYDIDGSELPEAVRTRADETQTTIEWSL